MRYIDEEKIENLLSDAKKAGPAAIDEILKKACSLKRLTLEETAALLAQNSQGHLKKLFSAAACVKEKVYGKRIVFFAPLYISNICANACLYCAFKSDNNLIKRKALTIDEIKEEVRWLLGRGHKRILMVAGEAAPCGKTNIEYYTESIKAIYSVNSGPHRIKRVNVNCAPLSTDEFRRLKCAGIGTYQVFQETYHDETYRYVHPSGPKSDPDNRIDAVERAFLAGIDDIGVGVLYGLYDWKFETLALLTHIEQLEKKFKVGPHTISVPRIEPALGAEFSSNLTHKVSDDDFKKLVAVLRLSVPYTGIILSTRENPYMRDELFSLGVSQISAESSTSPGGYASQENNHSEDAQFHLSDNRSMEDIIGTMIKKDFIPSFCAACYRKERTGEAFMNLARPGTIKGKCCMNALITLKEYLDDFASEEVKASGYKLINRVKKELSREDSRQLSLFFADIDKGMRDEFV